MTYVTWMIAFVIGVYLIAEKGLYVLHPKLEKRLRKTIPKRPEYTIKRMGATFILIALSLMFFASFNIKFSKMVLLVAAGWLLCMGMMATQLKPVKSLNIVLAKKSELWMRIYNLVLVLVGIGILYYLTML